MKPAYKANQNLEHPQKKDETTHLRQPGAAICESIHPSSKRSYVQSLPVPGNKLQSGHRHGTHHPDVWLCSGSDWAAGERMGRRDGEWSQSRGAGMPLQNNAYHLMPSLPNPTEFYLLWGPLVNSSQNQTNPIWGFWKTENPKHYH